VILVEIRPRGGAKQVIAVHPGVTVVGGLDPAARRTWATDLARAFRGETAASLDLEVEVDGRREPLTPDLVRRLGLADAAAAVTVFAVDLPGAKPAAPATDPEPEAVSATDAGPDLAALEEAVAEADARVRQLQSRLADAERAATAASDDLLAAGRHRDRDAGVDVKAAEVRLETARAAAASAVQQLRAAEEVERAASDEAAARATEAKGRVEQLQAELASLESQRAEIVARMVESGDPGDPAPVEQALAGLRRLRSVKPKPSAKALELADRWSAVLEQLGTLPQPPQPPEWLVTPALAALHEARAALAEATSGVRAEAIDPAQVEALDRAHREVLEAEQRAMKKGSRLNRRRLDAAHEAEQAALGALGVKSYGEYLQRIAPVLEGGGSSEDRVAAARAALADAEAVWEELHGGQASPEWTAVKEQQADLRTEAIALLGRDVEDHELEDALRSQLETVVDTEWAEQALATALRQAGATVAPDEEVEAAAERWLAEAPALLEARRQLEVELSEVDGRLSVVEEQLAEQQADAFFGDDTADPTSAGTRASGTPMDALVRAAREAEAAEAEAEAALADARSRQQANEASQGRLQELEAVADARRADVDRLRDELKAAEAELASTRAASAKGRDAGSAGGGGGGKDNGRGRGGRGKPTGAPPPAPAPAAPAVPGVDLSGVVGMEAEAYLLARVASLRGATGGGLPLVLDGEALTGLSDGAGRRVFRLLGRLVASMQVVVLGDDEKIATWAEGLGDQAAVRQAAGR